MAFDKRFVDLIGVGLPVIQAPMAGSSDADLRSQSQKLELSIASFVIMGPINLLAPEFPRAADALAPQRAKAEQNGSVDFSSLWCGQAGPMCQEIPAGQLTNTLAAGSHALMKRLS